MTVFTSTRRPPGLFALGAFALGVLGACSQPADDSAQDTAGDQDATTAITPAVTPVEGTPAITPEATPTPEASPTPDPQGTLRIGDKLTTDQLTRQAGEPAVATLKWTTQSEEDNFGFQVMRGPSEDGPFEPVNEVIISGAGNSSTERLYVFYDLTTQLGETYYYQIEQVNMDGSTEPASPLFPYTAARPNLGGEPNAPYAGETLPLNE